MAIALAFVLRRSDYDPDDQLGELIELNMRDDGEGSEVVVAPDVEGWYVDANLRRLGYGQLLRQAASGGRSLRTF